MSDYGPLPLVARLRKDESALAREAAAEIERLTLIVNETRDRAISECSRLLAALEQKQPVCYMQCEKHRGVPWTFTVYASTVQLVTVCPICHPPSEALRPEGEK